MNTLVPHLIKPELWLAALFAIGFAALAYGMKLLTRSGAIATAGVGFVVFGMGGGKFLVPLLVFFATSSVLSRIGRRRKAGANAVTVKGATRDAGQVLANGGAAALIALLFQPLAHHMPLEAPRYLLLLYLAALATVNADTWSTEIGGLSTAPPRLLSNWKRVAPGTSGAITGLGIFAALVGSLVVTLAGWLVWRLNAAEFVVVAWAGFLGSLLDSVLGASVQALYRDPVSGQPTEQPRTADRAHALLRGFRWINNDVVNFVASVGGILCAWLLLRFGVYPYR
ncbi:MAG: putative rane protein [Chthonomonadaceae bacterium]|nr:putative rane protein [Chthonomonadaceae bacterium]